MEAFENAVDYNGNKLYLMYDKTHKAASVFSLETELEQKLVVPFREALLGDASLIKAIPSYAN